VRRMALRIALQLAVSAAFIGVLLWRVNIGRLGSELHGAGWGWLAAAAPCFAASAVFGGVRWWLLARRAGPIPLRAGVMTLLAAGAVDLVLPLRAGTVALFQILNRRYGVHRAAIVGTAAAGGLVDVIATVALVVALSPVLALGRRSPLSVALIVAAVAALVTVALIIAVRRYGARRILRPLPPVLCERISRQVDYLLSGFSALGDVRSILPLLLLTFADWGAAATGYILVGHGFRLGVDWPLYLLVEAGGNLSGLVPLTEGNIGTYELAVRELLTAGGADGNRAAAFAVGAHAVGLLTTLVLAVVCAVAVRIRPHDLFYRDADTPRPAGPPLTARPRP